jgi:hypothetical protein
LNRQHRAGKCAQVVKAPAFVIVIAVGAQEAKKSDDEDHLSFNLTLGPIGPRLKRPEEPENACFLG